MAVERFSAQFPILYTDKDPTVIEQYGVYNLHGDGLASASIFIFNTEGETVWKSVGDRYSETVPAATVIDALDFATS